ncbi:MAG: TlpA disulfide reductase family protein [Gammaproteobacteria bacterium]
MACAAPDLPRRWAVAVVLWSVAGIASAAAGLPVRLEAPAEWIGHRLPVFSARSLDGPNLRTSEYAGDVVLLAFWGSGCARCAEPLAVVRALHATYRDAGLVTLGVAIDDSAAEARAYAAAQRLDFPHMLDNTRSIARRFALTELPTLMLVDRSGVVRQVYGRLDRKSRRVLVEDIRQLLDE